LVPDACDNFKACYLILGTQIIRPLISLAPGQLRKLGVVLQQFLSDSFFSRIPQQKTCDTFYISCNILGSPSVRVFGGNLWITEQ
jgi:hypothetical protein